MFKSSAAGIAQIQSNATYGSNGAEIGFAFDGELCPGCVGDIVNLLRTAPTTHREKAYDKPWSEADAPKSESPLSGLSDAELASELIKRQGLDVAKAITSERVQDSVNPGDMSYDQAEQAADYDMPRNVTKPDTTWS